MITFTASKITFFIKTSMIPLLRCGWLSFMLFILIFGVRLEASGGLNSSAMTSGGFSIEASSPYIYVFDSDWSDTLICHGDSVVLSAPVLPSPVQIVWSTTDTLPSISVSPGQSALYYVMVTNGQDTLYDTTQVIVLTVDAGPNHTICLSDSVVLGGVATPYNGIWSPSATLNQPNVYTPTAFPQQTTTYTLTVQHCTDSVKVTVITPPVISLGPDTSLCQGQPLALTPGSGYTSYQWSTGAVTPAVAVNASGSYWVRVANSFNCTASDTVNVTFIPYPALSMVKPVDSICAGDTAVIKVISNLTPVTYMWSIGGGNTDTLAVVPTGISVYRVTVTHQGCASTDSSLIILKPIPIPTLYCNKTMICAGETTMIQAATIYPGVSYQWSSGQTTPLISPAPTTGTMYSVTASLNGCSADTSLFIDVNQNPVVKVTSTPPSVCYGDTATFNAVSDIWGTQFQWSGGYTGPQVKLPLTAPVQMTVTGTVNGCTGSDSVWVSIKQVPDITVLMSEDTICAGDTVVLSASGSMAGTIFYWSTGVFVSQITVQPQLTTHYSVIATVSGCYSDTNVTVWVKPAPLLTVTPSPFDFCQGDVVTMAVTSDLPGTSFLWSDGTIGSQVVFTATQGYVLSVSGEYLGCTRNEPLSLNMIPPPVISLGGDGFVCEEETVTLTPQGSFQTLEWWDGSTGATNIVTQPGVYWVKAFNGHCFRTDTVHYRECSRLVVPNVFTPNGDGFNDWFMPEVKTIEIRSMAVYNRWGQRVYLEEPPQLGWNGEWRGQACAEGVYYYVIRYYNPMVKTVQEKGGSVTLLR